MAKYTRLPVKRGELRIYLGAAPGVGKTYAMLAEGQRRAARGTDVVIGLVESHGRRLTESMAAGLESVPRRVMSYRGAEFAEMDADAVLARHPQVALVDELAHSNVPGCRNAKRWQDVDELLAAGVDVISTLNIQHLESLNDVVAHITGALQRETLPDEVARRADQVELVDMTAEALRRRMVHGNVYPPDRIEAALTHYFRPGNLTALRELALLWVADRVEEGLQRYRLEHGIAAPWETRERILVGVAGVDGEEAIIRRAARIAAQTPGSDLFAVHVSPDDGLAVARSSALAAYRDLATSLGASFWQVTGGDVADALVEFANAENVTQMVIGASRHGRLYALLTGESTGSRVARRSGAVDVHYIGRGKADRGHLDDLVRSLAGTNPRGVRYLLVGVAAIAAALIAARLIPKLWPVRLGRAADIAVLAVVLVVAIAAELGLERAVKLAGHAAQERTVATVLARLAATMLKGRGDLPALLEEIRQSFGLDAVSLLESQPGAGRTEPSWYVVASTGEQPLERPGGDVEIALTDALILTGRGHALSPDSERVLRACCAQLAAAVERSRAGQRQARVPERAAGGRNRAAVLTAINQNARDQMVAAEQALAGLGAPGTGPAADDRAALIATVRRAVQRLGSLVIDLSRLSRLHAGALETYLRPVDLDDVLAASVDELGPGGHHIALRLPDDVPDVIADAGLLSRILSSLMADALHRSPADRPPELSAAAMAGHVEIRIADSGTVGPGNGSDSLALRLALELAEAMSCNLRCEAAGPGRTVVITLPAAARRSAAPAMHAVTAAPAVAVRPEP